MLDIRGSFEGVEHGDKFIPQGGSCQAAMWAAQYMVEVLLQIAASEAPFVNLVIPMSVEVHTSGEKVVLQFCRGDS
jgi:hypothetical protein